MNLSWSFLLAFVALLTLNGTESVAANWYSTEDDCTLASNDPTSEQQKQIDDTKYDCKLISDLLANCTCALDFVNCNGKGFWSMPTDLTRLPAKVTRMLFANNRISRLDALNLSNVSNIETLDLKYNRIDSIDKDAFGNGLASTVEYLRLCKNTDLNDFNVLNVSFPKLRELQLNRLQVSLRIKDGLFSNNTFPLLYKLYLNDVKLKFGEQPFNSMDQLNYLRLDSNGLTDLPCDNLAQLRSLVRLNLNYNDLNQTRGGLGNCLNKLTSLNELMLKSNRLSNTALDSLKLNNLEMLNLEENAFSRMPYSSLKELANLAHLRLTLEQKNPSESAFPVIKSLTKVWPKLTELDLSNSSIPFIRGREFVHISNELSELSLKNCKIVFIDPDAFSELDSLIFLDLSDNLLTELNQPTSNVIFDYDILKGNIDLRNNNFVCKPSIKWFSTFLSQPNFDKNLKCSLNNSQLLVSDYLASIENDKTPIKEPTNKLRIISITIFVLILIIGLTAGLLLIRRNQAKYRDQQYRYRYFNERCQDDGFDTDNFPVYRDCTVSLQIKDPDTSSLKNASADTSNQFVQNQNDRQNNPIA